MQGLKPVSHATQEDGNPDPPVWADRTSTRRHGSTMEVAQ